MTLYQKRIELGIAREQARKDLPLCLYTEAYWKIDLRNLLHFLGLRMEAHAQREIREYATIIGEKVVKPLFPLTWEAFEDFHLYAMTLSRPEQQLIRELTARPSLPVSKEAAIESLPEEWRLLPRCRERDEALSKLDCLGLVEENDRNTGV
jgi:thymidylate synthase (FAD)